MFGEGMFAYDPSGLCRDRRSDRLDRVGCGGLASARQVMISAQECREQAKRTLRPEDSDAFEFGKG